MREIRPSGLPRGGEGPSPPRLLYPVVRKTREKYRIDRWSRVAAVGNPASPGLRAGEPLTQFNPVIEDIDHVRFAVSPPAFRLDMPEGLQFQETGQATPSEAPRCNRCNTKPKLEDGQHGNQDNAREAYDFDGGGSGLGARG